MKYTVIFDNGKPYEEHFNTVLELKTALARFYDNNHFEGHHFDVQVFNEKDEDITEFPLITEMCEEIIENSEKKE
jgi:hypothetical protein